MARSLAAFGTAIVVLSLLITAVNVSFSAPLTFLALAAAIASGPLGGWFVASVDGSFPQALGLLVPATLACGVPLALAVFTRNPEWLLPAGFCWLFSGWFFAIGMWI